MSRVDLATKTRRHEELEMENGKWRMGKGEATPVLLSPFYIFHFAFLFFVSWCLGGLISGSFLGGAFSVHQTQRAQQIALFDQADDVSAVLAFDDR